MERHTEAKSFHSTAVLKNIATPPHPVPCLKASEVKGKPKRDRKDAAAAPTPSCFEHIPAYCNIPIAAFGMIFAATTLSWLAFCGF